METILFNVLFLVVPELRTILMVIAPIAAVGIGLFVGGASGSFNSILGWLRGTEAFEPRKQAVAIIEGFFAGMLAAWIEVQKFGNNPIDDYVFMLSLVTIFVMAGGLQNYASKAVSLIERRMLNNTEGTNNEAPTS